MKALYSLGLLCMLTISTLSQAASIPGLVNTGAGFNIGDTDTNYLFTSIAGTAIGTACGDDLCGVVTSDIGFPFPNWLSNDATSRWLVPSANQSQSYDPDQDGRYKWTLSFDLTGYLASTASFLGRFAADNGAEVWLNGTLLSTGPFPTGHQDWTPFSASNGFNAGLNTLEFFVTNERASSGNPTGLRVEFNSSTVSQVPLPAALILFASALPVLWLRHRRQ